MCDFRRQMHVLTIKDDLSLKKDVVVRVTVVVVAASSSWGLKLNELSTVTETQDKEIGNLIICILDEDYINIFSLNK